MKKIFALVLLAPLMAFASDRSVCEARDPAVDRAACMRELRNARAEKNLPSPSPEQALRNSVERCRVFKGNEAAISSCVDRVMQGTTTGNVDRGGQITTFTETYILVPMVTDAPK
jgi:hypothetical protein